MTVHPPQAAATRRTLSCSADRARWRSRWLRSAHAQRSAAAAREIKGLIGTSVDKVEQGTRMVADAGATMKEIVASVQRVNDIIGEISASASDQSDGIGQVNGAVTQLDHMTQQNAALVEQSAAAAESLKEQAHQLSHMVATFKLEPALTSR